MFSPFNILNICHKTICQNGFQIIKSRRGYKLQFYNNVSILTAVRTPWSSSYNQSEVGFGLHLQVAQAAVKRAAISDFNFDSIEERIEKDPGRRFYFIEQTKTDLETKREEKSCKDIGKEKDLPWNLMENLQNVESGNTKTLLLSEFSAIEKYFSANISRLKNEENTKRFLEARGNNLFDAEILTIQSRKMADDNRKRAIMLSINRDLLPFCIDESEREKVMAVSAVIFQNDDHWQKPLDITNLPANLFKTVPLADLHGFMILNNQDEEELITNIQKSLNEFLLAKNLNLNKIDNWLTNEDGSFQNNNNLLSVILNTKLGLQENRINSLGITNVYKTFQSQNIAWLLTHAAHHIKPGCYCCLLKLDHNWTLTVFLLQGRAQESRELPLLTLFTKENCPLCDNLVEELALEFAGQIHLEKIFIDDASNKHFWKLYEYDIPVLFLNGKFICMHRLNVALMRRELEIIRENSKKQQSF